MFPLVQCWLQFFFILSKRSRCINFIRMKYFYLWVSFEVSTDWRCVCCIEFILWTCNSIGVTVQLRNILTRWNHWEALENIWNLLYSVDILHNIYTAGYCLWTADFIILNSVWQHVEGVIVNFIIFLTFHVCFFSGMLSQYCSLL
jgi:hypothetical protein